MFEWLIDSILGNGYLKAAAIFVLFYTLSEIAVVIFEKVFLRLARKTKTDLDDIIVKNLKRPISFLLLSLGFKLAFVSIGLEGRWDTILNGITSTLVVVTVIYIIKTVIEVLVLHWGVKFASKTESTMDDNLVNLAQKALGVGFIVVSFLFVLKVWGVEIAPLLAGLGVGGIAIAFALQKSLGNVFGGISLILDKSITVGDTVVIDETTKGTILDIGLRSTKIRTFDNEVIIVPNGRLEDMMIKNIVKPDPSARVVIPFGVAYGSDVAKVKKIVLKEIMKIEGRKEEPEAIVRFSEMGDSALLFKAYFWMESYKDRFRSIDEVNTGIYNALNKAKIEIPYPQMDVHIRK